MEINEKRITSAIIWTFLFFFCSFLFLLRVFYYLPLQRTFNGFVSEWSNTDKPALQICAICLKNVPANYLIFTLEDCAYTFVLPDYIISAFELNHVYKWLICALGCVQHASPESSDTILKPYTNLWPQIISRVPIIQATEVA